MEERRDEDLPETTPPSMINPMTAEMKRNW